jgi:hypothetical protein
VAIRRLWIREIKAMLEGKPLKQWDLTEPCTPSAWALGGGEKVVGGAGTKPAGGPVSKIFDSRPHIEVERELSALRGEPRR